MLKMKLFLTSSCLEVNSVFFFKSQNWNTDIVNNQDNSLLNLADDTKIVAITDQISCNISDETVVLSFKDGVYYGMNAVGSHIWELIQEPRTMNEIRKSIQEVFDVTPEQCDLDLESFLKEIHERNLLEIKDKEGS